MGSRTTVSVLLLLGREVKRVVEGRVEVVAGVQPGLEPVPARGLLRRAWPRARGAQVLIRSCVIPWVLPRTASVTALWSVLAGWLSIYTVVRDSVPPGSTGS